MSCVLWTGAISRATGYGMRQMPGTRRTTTAHRVAYCVHHGLGLEDIAGQVVRHTCDTPLCTNPAHLLLGEVADNIADRVSRGRSRKTYLRRAYSSDERAAIVALHRSGNNLSEIARSTGFPRTSIKLIVESYT